MCPAYYLSWLLTASLALLINPACCDGDGGEAPEWVELCGQGSLYLVSEGQDVKTWWAAENLARIVRTLGHKTLLIALLPAWGTWRVVFCDVIANDICSH